ncbi:MAG: phage tail sheath C-terminal domain-containing protein [Candidatus Metalachnospira sp.]|jgi:hypothetical protein
MAQNMPNIEVIFKQKAVTAIQRSERGVVCVIVNDDTEGTATTNKYELSADVKETEYTAENYKAILGAFIGIPRTVYVVKIGAAKKFTDAKPAIAGIDFNWLCYLNATSTEQDAVAAYIKETNAKNKRKKRKAVVYKATTTDDMHVVNFTNEAIKFKNAEAAYPVQNYVARIAGLLAGLPFTRAATYTVMQELESVTESADLDAAVNKGEFILWNDSGEVRVGRAVNTLTTLGEDQTADMQKITIVEAMDLILEDIVATFNDYYCGKYKNSYDNQVLFIAAVNVYFKQLGRESILDPNFENLAQVNVEKQREDWISTGKPEAVDWDEQKVKNMTFRSFVNLTANIKVLDAMEDLNFIITMA